MNQFISTVPPLAEMKDFKEWILYENEDLLVLNKPGWLVCHPSKNGPFSSLVGVSKEYLCTDRLHLASRLDRETSGVVLLAKNRKAASYWQKGIERKTVKRAYLAILEGVLNERKVVSTYLGKDPDSPVYVKQRVTNNSRKAKHAETIFSPIVSNNGYTFCSVTTLTGRKHQIRIHAQWLNYPLVGEKLYGKDEEIYLEFCENGWRDEWIDIIGMYRQALHGRCLIDTNSDQEFLAPLPNDFMDFLISRMNLNSEEINKLIREADEQLYATLFAN